MAVQTAKRGAVAANRRKGSSPIPTAGLRSWWKADAITSPPADGAALATWTDSTATGANLTQATSGLRPTYRTTGGFLPNGKPVVEFTRASTTWMQNTSAVNNGATTRFMVVRFKTVPAAQQDLYAGASGYGLSIDSAGKLIAGIPGVASLNMSPLTTTVTVGPWYVLCFDSNGSNDHHSFINNVAESSSTDAETITGVGLAVGGRNDNSNASDCYLAEVVDYSAVLNSTDRATVYNYLAAKYAVGVTVTITTADSYQTLVQSTLNTWAARSDVSTPYTMQFAPGTYDLSTQWTVTGLQNVHLTSQDPANKALINKGASWNSEYLLRLFYGANLRISYLGWKGDHVYNEADTTVHYSDQGVWFTSCHDTRIDHCDFTDIGNAAIRQNTDVNDPVQGVNSYNHLIELNTFVNCDQITTSQDSGSAHGGSHHWTFQNNTVTTLRESIKFASRTAGGHTGKILNNTIVSHRPNSEATFEASSTNSLEIAGNTIHSAGGGIIFNCYTNPAAAAGFDWCADFNIHDNVCDGCQDGWRFSLDDYPDAYSPQGTNMIFTNNTTSNLTTTNGGQTALRVVNGGISGITFTNNAFNNLANNAAYSFDAACTGITKSGNTKDGSALP